MSESLRTNLQMTYSTSIISQGWFFSVTHGQQVKSFSLSPLYKITILAVLKLRSTANGNNSPPCPPGPNGQPLESFE